MKYIVIFMAVMHQSFVAPAPLGPQNSGAFNFSIFKALLKALHCRTKFVVKSTLKAPAPGGWQTTTDLNHLNKFSPLSRGGPTWTLSSVGSVISKKNLNTHMHIHTHIKELLALNTVRVPGFLHTRTQQLRVAPDEQNIVAVCVHLQIK